jgi:hypothetical protein
MYVYIYVHVDHKEKDKNCLQTGLKSLEVREQVKKVKVK